MAAVSSPSPPSPLKVVEYVYDEKISYERGAFNYQCDETGYATVPNSPSESQPQSVLQVPDQELKEVQEEMVLKKAHPGKDGRERVSHTHRFPHSIHAQIEMAFPDGNYGGSGVLVGPHHVFTCAHNVYNFNKTHWASRVEVYPARNKESAPFGRANVTRAYIFENWVNQGDKRFDVALLILNQSVGFMTGWGGLFSGSKKELIDKTVQITGYPGDKSFDEMWEMSHRIKQVFPEIFEYEIDTAPGQSGSAIWSMDSGFPVVLGVHTLGSNQINSGVRISQQKFLELFAKYISDTYRIKNAMKQSFAPLAIDSHEVNSPMPEYDVEALRKLLTCPLSRRMFKDPVTEGEGTCKHTFERAFIYESLKKSRTCPISHKPLELAQLVDNQALKSACTLLNPDRVDPLCDEELEDIHEAVKTFVRNRTDEAPSVSGGVHKSLVERITSSATSVQKPCDGVYSFECF